MNNSFIREPAVAGQFYSDNVKELTLMIETFYKNVSISTPINSPITVMVPHAGYVFSGQTAAYAFKTIDKKTVTNIILIGNSHNYLLKKPAIFEGKAFRTPFGIVPTNSSFINDLSKTSYFSLDNEPHIPEHSLEVQLPFLQKHLQSFSIVPILFSEMPLDQCSKIGEAIASVIRSSGKAEQTLIVASSDMSHYPSQKNAESSDTKVLKSLERFDPTYTKKTIDDIMSSNIPDQTCALCGAESVYIAMFAAKALGATKAQTLHYSNSGSVYDPSRVVGYGAASFSK